MRDLNHSVGQEHHHKTAEHAPVLTAQSVAEPEISADLALDGPGEAPNLLESMVRAAGFAICTTPTDCYALSINELSSMETPSECFRTKDELLAHLGAAILQERRPGYIQKSPDTLVDVASPRWFLREATKPMSGGPLRDYIMATFSAVKNPDSVFYAYPDNHQAYLGCLRTIAISPSVSEETREQAGAVEDAWFSCGQAMPNQALLPYATKVSDLFEETRVYGATGTLYGTNRGLIFSGYSMVRDLENGHLGRLEVVPSKALLNALDRSMIKVDGDRIFTEAICQGDSVAIYARYNQIIGHRLLAVGLESAPFKLTNPPRI